MDLASLRKRKGLTQSQAASLIGVSRRGYQYLESGKGPLSSRAKALDALSGLPDIALSKQSILVVGAGYVGYALGVLFSRKHLVSFLDIDERKNEAIRSGQNPLPCHFPFTLPSLKAERPKPGAFAKADIILIALPTPWDETKQTLSLSSIEPTLEQIHNENPEALVIIKSTMPIGSSDGLAKRFGLKRLYVCPEFLREANPVEGCLMPSRIVVGGKDQIEALGVASLFLEFAKEKAPIRIVSRKEAEAIKLFSNGYLAMRLAYWNELASFAALEGVSADAVIDAVCDDPRIGRYYNIPKEGYGGSCLPKDVLALNASLSSPHPLIGSIDQSNQERKEFLKRE